MTIHTCNLQDREFPLRHKDWHATLRSW